jgi:ATP-binding cassette subfamily C protein/ATP-binding cassette subfamily C protein LapB
MQRSISQINALMQLNDERGTKVIQTSYNRLKGKVQFGRVSLRYSSNADPALLGVSFEVKPGEVIAIIGHNGCGRSSTLKLMLGMHHPQAGKILIDDRDVRQTNSIELRQSIGYAPQTCQFFFGTIAQNLRLAHPTATDTELEEAAAMADVLAEIRALPKGFYTRIGDSQVSQMPASFQHRLNLARTFLKKAPIMLFDEPESGLDFGNDQVFMASIRKIRGNATVFLSTHRPSYMRLADQVVWLVNGRVHLAGPPDQVVPRFLKALS